MDGLLDRRIWGATPRVKDRRRPKVRLAVVYYGAAICIKLAYCRREMAGAIILTPDLSAYPGRIDTAVKYLKIAS